MHIHISRLAGIIFLLFLSYTHCNALDSRERAAMIDSLQGQLSIAPTAADSIKPLYDIFDMSYGLERDKLAHQLYLTARQAKNDPVRLDMLRNIANQNWRNDSILQYVSSELKSMKQTPEVISTRLFTDMICIDNLLFNEHAGHSREQLLEYVRRYSNEVPSDDYDRAVLLYAVCRYLGEETRGDLLENYLERLDKLVETMNLPDGAVRRLIYNRAAPIFFENGNYPKVIETDMKLLHEIDSLQLSYEEEGRVYYNAPIHRYKSYRRMLGCFPVLSDSEVEDLYGKILSLADMNTTIAGDLERNERAHIYYAMATGDYQRAKKMLLKQIDSPAHTALRLSMLRMLKDAANKTGDGQILLEASQELNNELERQLDTKCQERTRELELVYDLSDLLHRNSQLEESSHLTTLRARTIVTVIGAVAFIGLALLAAMLYRQNRRNRRLAHHLRRANEKLQKERDDLKGIQEELTTLRDEARAADRRKTEFVNNMSHEVKVPLAAIAEYAQLITDCIPENQRAYLDRFASIINLNVKLVTRLVNDVLDTESIENDQLSLEIRPTAVNDICHLAIDNVFECGRPDKSDINFVFKPGADNSLLVETDGQRVSQVLVNLLTNAVKFSEKGTVTLSYTVDTAANKLEFTVTDQGIGIPDGQEEAIFDRFRRLDHTTPGFGLGLYISRLIASVLGGSLKVDTAYRGGARFIFTIPVRAQQ